MSNIPSAPGAGQPFKPLGGVLRPGAEHAALHRLLTCAMMGEPRHVDELWVFAAVVATGAEVDGQRVWWRLFDRDSQSTHYISKRPGEFRTEEPTDPHDIVLDPPEDFNAPKLSELLAGVVASLSFAGEATIGEIRAAATRVLLTFEQPVFPEAGEIFAAQAARVRGDARGQLAPAITALHRECLFKFKMPVSTFVPAAVLLQLQANTGQYIQESVDYTDAYPVLRAFVAQLSATERASLSGIFESAVGVMYRGGKKQLQQALDAYGNETTGRHLLHAAADFATALCLHDLNDRFSIGAAMPYRAVLADEGFACVNGGLSDSTTIFLEEPASTLSMVSDLLRQSPGSDAPVFNHLSSPLSPQVSRPFARVLAAAATAASEPANMEASLQALHDLEAEFQAEGSLDTAFEQGWLTNSLLQAYKGAGRQDMVKLYATRLATTLTLERSL